MSKIRDSLVTNCEKKFLLTCLSEYRRLDGRAFGEFRDLTIKYGKDWGSCYVTLGKTQVLAQTSCEVVTPKTARPSEGILTLNLELNPIAAPSFEAGRQSEQAIQLTRLLEKVIKDSKAVDLESLCIKTKEKVWSVRVDLNAINQEGNLLDCASVAALASLAHFRRPDVTCDGEEFIVHNQKQRDPIPIVIHHFPVCISFAIFNGGAYILADPTLLEEGVADAFLTVGLNSFKELCTLHLGGKVELDTAVILKTVTGAVARANLVIEEIKSSIKLDNEAREANPVGFQDSIDFKRETNELIKCLDQWEPVKSKAHKRKVVGEIEVVDKGSAAFVPAENEDLETKLRPEIKPWVMEAEESDENEEVVFVELPPSKVEKVEISDSDSEEDDVVIIEGNP